MDIDEADKKEIVALSEERDIYEQMTDSIAPSIYGYDQEKLAIALQLFSGVTKHLPDESRIRGDLHVLLIGDPGTGKCLDADTNVQLADGTTRAIGELVEANLNDPKPVDDGVWDHASIPLPTLAPDGSLTTAEATKVWKREAPAHLYRIRTDSGRELDVTPSHPLFVQQDGRPTAVEAEKLEEGQFVATPRSVPAPGDDRIEADYRDVLPVSGETLREIRESLSLSQSDCGLSRATYQHYERGDRNPSRESLRAVVDAFEERLAWLKDQRDGLAGEDWETIVELRDELSISQQSLADGMDVTQTAISYYERNEVAPDGGETVAASGVVRDRLQEALAVESTVDRLGDLARNDVRWDRIASIEAVDPDDEWVYDLEVEGTHSYVSNGVVSHNSQILQYIRHIAPRSVFTSGKGSSSAGLCVTGDTRIQTEDGFRQIRDVVTEDLPESVATETAAERAIDVQSFDREGGEMDARTSSHVWRMPEKPTRRIETEYGKELEASVNTPVLTCGSDGIEWAEISDIEAGDFIAAPRFEDLDRSEVDVRDLLTLSTEKVRLTEESIEFLRTELTEEFGTLRDAAAALDLSEDFIYLHLKNRHVPLSKLDRMLKAIDATRSAVDFERLMVRHGESITIPESFDADLMYLLGLVFGDGDISLDRRDGNRGMVRISNGDEALLERAADIFEAKFDKRPEIERQNDRVPCIRVNSVTIARLFENAGMESPKKHLALAPELTVTEHGDAFLRGLMDADGSVSVRGEKGGSSVQLSTISETLGEQVQLMLESYGVKARLRERDRRGTSELADGHEIESGHVQYFLELYGAEIDRYAEAIGFESIEKQTALEEIVREERRQREKIPVGSALAAVDGVAGDYYQNVNRGDNPGRARARSMLADIDLGPVEPLVEEAVEADLRWEEVVAAVDTGEKEVFDLTVPETHNFLGNGLVTHNTAAAVRDDFGDGQQWTLEAGALVLADRGIAAVDELDKMRSEDRSAMHEALEQQSYHPDSELLLADGRRVEIGNFVDQRMGERSDDVIDGVDCEILPVDDVSVHSADLDDNEVQKLPVDRVSRHEAPEEFVRVSFSNGREVVVTPEHPMFVAADGDIDTLEARHVDEGYFVPAPRKLPNSAATVPLEDESQNGKEKDIALPAAMSPDLAEILGFLIAEGHSYAGSAHEIGFSNQDERLLDRMDELMGRVFGMGSTDTTNAAGTVTKRWISTQLYRWFQENFPEFMHTARDKRIPSKVLGASEEEIRRFLVGAFQGDGGVESEAMAFCTASPGLAEDYADALSKIGVATRIHHDDAEDSWKTYVMGDSTERFVTKIVQPRDDRYEDAQTFVERSNETPRHHDVLPTDAARELRELRNLLGLRKTGQFKPNLENDFGVHIGTVEAELDTLRERAEEIRSALEAADDLAAVRNAIGWSGRQLAERLENETTSAVHYAESGGYDAERRALLRRQALEAAKSALTEFEQRAETLESRTDFRYYRVTDVETLPNEGEHATEWVYDVTVEPTNTFVSQGVVLHNSISISKAGINATLKSRCSLLGAANPKYGRFDQYEPIGEQIDLEPALISRFDLIFTVTDEPDEEADAELAEHILRTNYAGELNTHREQNSTPDYSAEEVESVTDTVAPEIDPELLRKYVAYAKRSCFPTMTEEAKAAIRDFYVELRTKGSGEDAPVPVTARKLEALVRLAEASARVRLSDTVEAADAERVIGIVRSSLEDIGIDPETGELDADVVETGTSKSQRDRIKNIRGIIADIEEEYDEGAPVDVVIERAEEVGMDASKAEHEIEKLKQQGEVYEPRTDHLRTT
ncbi:LAGLIDADG family homing endonuclease [Halorhabdus tiamatea]